MRIAEEKKVVSRKWHWQERKAEREGYLVESREQGWIKRKRGEWHAMSVVICGYCREDGTKEGENFVRIDCVHNMWYAGCEPYKERLDRKIEQGRKYRNKCHICERKWVGAEKYKGIC